MRAVWSPELETSAELDNKLGDTFGFLARTAMGPANCAAIVHNSSDLKQYGYPQRIPPPIKVKE